MLEALRRSEAAETSAGHSPPESAEDHAWYWLALKFALAMFLVDWSLGFFDLATHAPGIITAGFLVTSGPVASVRSGLERFSSFFVGGALGVLGGYWGLGTNDVPAGFFLLLGAVTGLLASWRAGFSYAAVIGTVTAIKGAGGDQSLVAVALETGLQIAVGCMIGPLVVWVLERARAAASQ